MIIFPAVDIKDGQAVRLRQGRVDELTVFSDNPVEMALHWQTLGARFLHLVDLDGAFDGQSANVPLVSEICTRLSIPVQLGGGIRDEETARRWLKLGVTRLIVGTMALEEPELFSALCHAFPGRIGVSLDADNGKLMSRGWLVDSGLTVHDIMPRLLSAGAAFIVYTDISRDGTGHGVNLPALSDLAETSPIPIIASGGVATLEDIKALYPLTLTSRLEGVITGRALYENKLDLGEAMRWIAAQASS